MRVAALVLSLLAIGINAYTLVVSRRTYLRTKAFNDEMRARR